MHGAASLPSGQARLTVTVHGYGKRAQLPMQADWVMHVEAAKERVRDKLVSRELQKKQYEFQLNENQQFDLPISVAQPPLNVFWLILVFTSDCTFIFHFIFELWLKL